MNRWTVIQSTAIQLDSLAHGSVKDDVAVVDVVVTIINSNHFK